MVNHLTVSDLVTQVKGLLEGEFRQVSVVGEVSNLSASATGHYYFTLSDRDSSLSVALFRGDALRNPFIKKCRDGDKVYCQGGLGVYSKRGTFQLIARNMAPAGKGDLQAELEALKNKLRAQGLFDEAHKRPLPTSPKRVAIITAKGAAALQDFINIFARRSFQMDLVVIPSLVQGSEAPRQLVGALRRAIKYSLDNPENGFDVIVLARGGGSLEDLWAFNDEALAWEIHNCPIPVISAVGHQVDYSLSDYVADLRAETPSAAAELLTEQQREILHRLSQAHRNLYQKVEGQRRYFRSRQEGLSPKALVGLMKNILQERKYRFQRLDFEHRALRGVGLDDYWLKLDDLTKTMDKEMERSFKDRLLALNYLGDKVQLLDPHRPLEKGYAYIKNESGKLIKNLKDYKNIDNNKAISLHFIDGVGKAVKK